MTLDLMADMDSAFLNCGLEEPISYIVSGSVPVTHASNAMIFRGQDAKINLAIKQSNGDIARKYDIEIYISRTEIPAVKINADTVQLKRFPGDTTNTTMRVAGIVRMDEGAFRLGLA